MGESKAQVGDRQGSQANAEPQEAIPEHNTFQPDQSLILLQNRPGARDLFDEEIDPNRVQQHSQTRADKPVHKGGDEVAHEEQEHAPGISCHTTPAPHRQRKLKRRGNKGGRQGDVGVGGEVGIRAERTDDLGRYTRRVDAKQDACLHTEQDQSVQQKGGEKSSAQIFRLADGSRVHEWMHTRLHVPRRHFASHRGADQEPDDAAEHRREGNAERRILERGFVRGPRDRHDEESKCKRDGETKPRREAAPLVGEFEEDNLPELHNATFGPGRCARPPMWPAIVLK